MSIHARRGVVASGPHEPGVIGVLLCHARCAAPHGVLGYRVTYSVSHPSNRATVSIKFSLLSLLAEQPRPVGQLRTVFETRTASVWPINVGQVYQTVQRLNRDGLIVHSGVATSESGRGADVYSITDAGREALAEWWSSPVLPPRDSRDELVIKIAMATGNPAINTRALLQRQRQALMAELKQVTRMKAGMPVAVTAERLLLERRIFDLEAQGRWLDHIETLPITSQEQA